MNNSTSKPTKISFARSEEFSYKNVKFSAKIVWLSNFYTITTNWKKYLVACFVGVFMGFGTLFFVELTGLCAGGSAAIFQGLARLIHVIITKQVGQQDWANIIYNVLFWGMYLVLNLLIFASLYKKLNRQCIIISLIYLIMAQLTGFLLSLIPNIDNIAIFGDTSNVNEHLKSFGVQCIIYSPNVWPSVEGQYIDNAKYIWDFNKLIINPNDVPDQVMFNVFNLNIVKSLLLIIYALVYSMITSVSNAILYIIGGSSAGSEMIALYLSEEKNKSITYSLRIFQIVALFIGTMFGAYLSGVVIYAPYYAGWQYIFSANLVASFIWIFANSFILNRLFPSHKIVKIEVFTQNVREIVNELKKYNYNHPTTIVNSTGGYSGMKNNILITVLPLFEVSSYIKVIRTVDSKCLISTIFVDGCDGNISLQKHKSIEKASIKHGHKAR